MPLLSQTPIWKPGVLAVKQKVTGGQRQKTTNESPAKQQLKALTKNNQRVGSVLKELDYSGPDRHRSQQPALLHQYYSTTVASQELSSYTKVDSMPAGLFSQWIDHCYSWSEVT